MSGRPEKRIWLVSALLALVLTCTMPSAISRVMGNPSDNAADEMIIRTDRDSEPREPAFDNIDTGQTDRDELTVAECDDDDLYEDIDVDAVDERSDPEPDSADNADDWDESEPQSSGDDREVPVDEEQSDQAEEGAAESGVDHDVPSTDEPPPTDTEPPVSLEEPDLGNWTSYNGVIFGDASIHRSQSGGGLAVGGALTVHNNVTVGSTYSTQYDPTLHIGEYRNEGANPALLLSGDSLQIDDTVTDLVVHGGAIAMPPALLEVNGGQPVGFAPGDDSFYQTVDSGLLQTWFDRQYEMAQASSELMLLGNDVEIDIAALSDGSYLQAGPEAYRNHFFEVDGEIHENALFITVRTGSELNFGQWWPVHTVLHVDVNWVIDSDLVIFNFPDAVNVTMNSSAFAIQNMEHWSTTVDAWVGERGMTERKALAEKVVYNFPAARSIETNQALIQGTILAPNASFTGVGARDAGHIYGHIVAARFVARGDFTIHAFTLTHWVYDIVEDELAGQTDSGVISLRHYLYFDGEPTSIRAAGGDFVLEDEDGRYFDGAGKFVPDIDRAAVYTTEPDAYTHIRGVPLGDYTLVKRAAPEGFALNDADPDNLYTYARLPVSLPSADRTVYAVRYSEPVFTDLHFRKVDADTGQGLAGAVFTIVREGDAFQDATAGGLLTSGEDGRFTSRHVPIGTYHMVEIEPPPGHSLVAGGEVRFSVYWDEQAGALAVRGPDGETLRADEHRPMEIPDEPGNAGNTVMLIKYTEDRDEPGTFFTLPDAGFFLYRYDEGTERWRPVEQDIAGETFEIVTNELGYYRIDDLPNGAYRLVETVPPPGYTADNRHEDETHSDVFPHGYAYEFTFSDTVSFYTAYIPNKPLEMQVTVAVSGSMLETIHPLSGAGFRLEHLLGDDKTWEEWVSAAETDAGGELLLTGLTTGSYRLTQLHTARGFRVPDPAVLYFTVAFDGAGAPLIEATYDGHPVGQDTQPVAMETGHTTHIRITNAADACDYLVYKIDGDYTIGKNWNPSIQYRVDYLENAAFRLQRRPGARNIWEDYGEAFVSVFQYTDDGRPLLDSYGNHIAAAPFAGGLLYGEYRLIETHPPDGFSADSSLEVTLGDGGRGFLLHQFTVTEGMAATGRPLTYTAANYAVRPANFQFRLVDAENHDRALAGGAFALYLCGEEHVHDKKLAADSCWARSTPALAVSGGDGMVEFAGLAAGDYLLRQDSAPAGHRLPGALWTITVDSANAQIDTELLSGAPAYAFVEAGEGDARWLLPAPKAFALPMTGGGGTLPLTATGAVLVIAATLLKMKTKKL